MDVTGEQKVVVPANLRALYAPVADELVAVEEFLRRELSSDNPFVNRLAQHGFRLGGKRLRPALVLLTAKACGNLREEHVRLAAMAELIHTATLVHDDVLDEATIRRHLDTVNARWNNEASILLGDYLFARAMCLASASDDSFASRMVSETARRMCEGELRQIEGRGDYELGESDYFDIIAGKTAALTACCCHVGAHYARADENACQAMARYGYDLGIAFQIADDVLDLLGDEETVGKTLGSDLVKQKATLPLIRLLSSVGTDDRVQIISLLKREGNHHRDALKAWFDRCDAIPYARQKAISFTQRAADELAAVPAGDATNSLRGLTEFVVSRHQ